MLKNFQGFVSKRDGCELSNDYSFTEMVVDISFTGKLIEFPQYSEDLS